MWDVSLDRGVLVSFEVCFLGLRLAETTSGSQFLALNGGYHWLRGWVGMVIVILMVKVDVRSILHQTFLFASVHLDFKVIRGSHFVLKARVGCH